MILRCVDSYSVQEEENNSASEGLKGEDSYPCKGDLIMMRKVLSSQPSHQALSQRKSIFYIRCRVSNKTCSLIVDSDWCCNCCSTRLVEKLSLIIIPHPKPYKHQWLNEGEDLNVN